MSDIDAIYNDWQHNRRALDQSTHEAINARHYPGTRQMCAVCDDPTGSCEEDARWFGDLGPLCEECWHKAWDKMGEECDALGENGEVG